MVPVEDAATEHTETVWVCVCVCVEREKYRYMLSLNTNADNFFYDSSLNDHGGKRRINL